MKAILVGVDYDHISYDLDVSLAELKELARACHMDVEKVMIQKLSKPTGSYYIGKGKVEELKNLIHDETIVIFNEELSPLQMKNLQQALDVEVSDRSDLILKIFALRARSKEAKLQVEIARGQYLLPRLVGMKEELYSQQGGSGFRGSGETQLELDRRLIYKRLNQAQRELQQIVKQRQTQRHLRQRRQEKVVCLVGYTNSGKSSLLNYFTNKKVYEEDMLFASLQTVSRKICLKGYQNIVMSDTIGFIHQLPHHLIQAFRSTLEEVKEADLLVHVIDSSSPYCHEHIATTCEVLKALGVEKTPMIYVYNKIDKSDLVFLQPQHPNVFISVKEEKNLEQLEDLIIETLLKSYCLKEYIIPYQDGFVFQKIKATYQIVKEDYLDEAIYISCYIDEKGQHQYQKYLYQKIH